jgi:NAD(P)H dehydrogenase (quinone)
LQIKIPYKSPFATEGLIMKSLIIFCHPEPASFNGALKDVAVDALQIVGHEVRVTDLHAEGFDPVEKAEHYVSRCNPDWFSPTAEQRHASADDTLPPEIKEQIALLEWADLVILQFPLWWHAQPAMLKGWFDRVFVNGGLFTGKMRYDRGYFRGKHAICSVTTGAPQAAFGGNGRGGNMDVMLWPIQYSLYYMGFSVLKPFLSYGIQAHKGFVRLKGNAFEDHLETCKRAWRDRLTHLDVTDQVQFPGWDDWDEDGHPIAGASDVSGIRTTCS